MNPSRDYTPYTIAGLLALLVGVFLYVYLVNVSVVEVVVRKELIQERNKLQTEIAMQETAYIEAQHKIATNISELDGYAYDTAKIFVTRDAASLALQTE